MVDGCEQTPSSGYGLALALAFREADDGPKARARGGRGIKLREGVLNNIQEAVTVLF